MMKLSSIKTKFIVVACLVCLICLFIVSSISYSIAYKILENEANEKEKESVSKYANQFNTWFVDQGRALTGIVEDIEINQDFSDEYLSYYLSSKLKIQPGTVIDYYMGFPAGERQFIDGSGWKPPPEFDCTKRKWYAGALKNDGLVYTTPYLDASTGKMIFTIARPVKDGKKLVGVAAADILLTELMTLAEQSKTRESDYAFLLDNEQNFLVHPNREFQPRPQGLKNAAQVLDGRYIPIVEQIKKHNYETIQLLDYDGTRRFLVLSTIESTNWTFGVAISTSQYMENLNKLWIGFVIALAISLALGSLVILLFMNNLLRPVVQLKTAVDNYSHKDFSSRSPVSTDDEIGQLSRSFNMMADTIQEYSQTLEQKVEERTRELQETNLCIMQSIDYAQRIQSSILPDLEKSLGLGAGQCFVIWKPRDIVGGDFYWCKHLEEDYCLAVADCTGHGVPGALMTMTASVLLDRVSEHISDHNPAVILHHLDRLLRQTLRQDHPQSLTNDGLDIGLCVIKPKENVLLYAGARISLICCQDGRIAEIKGARQSLGYKNPKNKAMLTSTELKLDSIGACYMSTDGLFDQNGENDEIGLGSKRFKEIIQQNHEKPMPEQENMICQVLKAYMGTVEQRDDITVLGIRIDDMKYS